MTTHALYKSDGQAVEFALYAPHTCTRPAVSPVMLTKFATLQDALDFRAQLYKGSCRVWVQLTGVSSEALDQLENNPPKFRHCWKRLTSNRLLICGAAEKVAKFATGLAEGAPQAQLDDEDARRYPRSHHRGRLAHKSATVCSFCKDLGYKDDRRAHSFNT